MPFAVLVLLLPGLVAPAEAPTVRTVFGTGVPGYSNTQTHAPFGLAFGPDRALYFCEMDGQRVRRLISRRDASDRRRQRSAGYAATAARRSTPS